MDKDKQSVLFYLAQQWINEHHYTEGWDCKVSRMTYLLDASEYSLGDALRKLADEYESPVKKAPMKQSGGSG